MFPWAMAFLPNLMYPPFAAGMSSLLALAFVQSCHSHSFCLVDSAFIGALGILGWGEDIYQSHPCS